MSYVCLLNGVPVHGAFDTKQIIFTALMLAFGMVAAWALWRSIKK